ncbi:MAG TPA: MobH family relaxase [Burkholderiaceae bacterium]
MFSLFQRKRPDAAAAPANGAPPAPAPETPCGFTRPESARSLLATPRRQRLLAHIWQRTSLSRPQFAALYQAPVERYAELVQQLPASESHHHAYPGGMLDHGLEIVAYALKLRQSQLMPADATPEEQAAQAEAWTAGAAYAALLHDLGKVAVDLHVELADGTVWHPWHGPLQQPYRFRYRAERQYRLHGAATGLLYTRVLDRHILDWLSAFPELWASVLFVLAGQYEHAGAFGELVVRADQASVAQALGGDPTKALAAPRESLQRRLLEGLRFLLKTRLKLNQAGPSDGWLTQDALWLVSKTVSDQLRAHLLSQGMDGIPSGNPAIFSVMQEHGIVQAAPDGKAIWTARVTSDSGWSHSFTFLRLAPAAIWEAGERPPPFAGTVVVEQGAGAGSATAQVAPRPTSVHPAQAFDAEGETPDPGGDDGPDAPDDLLGPVEVKQGPTAAVDAGAASARPSEAVASPAVDVDVRAMAVPPTEAVSGEHFFAWLRHAVLSRKLVINDARALVHTVDDTAYLVSPGLFHRYAQEHPEAATLAKREGVADWEWVQKRFEKLQLHRKQPGGLNIWTCQVNGPRKSRRLHGYLLKAPEALFEELPPNNPFLSLAP